MNWIGLGRVLRGGVGGAALVACSAMVLLTFAFACCGGPDLRERLTSPGLWFALASLPVAVAALPPVSRRLRASPVRWALAPLLIPASIAAVVLALGVPEFGIPAALAALAIGICTLYVAVRVLPSHA